MTKLSDSARSNFSLCNDIEKSVHVILAKMTYGETQIIEIDPSLTKNYKKAVRKIAAFYLMDVSVKSGKDKKKLFVHTEL